MLEINGDRLEVQGTMFENILTTGQVTLPPGSASRSYSGAVTLWLSPLPRKVPTMRPL